MTFLKDIHHLAILTADLDRLIAFYRRIFEASVTMDLEDEGLRHAFIAIGPHTVLHAFQIPGVMPATDQPIFRRGRLDHFALQAASEEAFRELRRRIVAEGAADGGVTDMGSLLNFGFVDPDGGHNEVVWVKPGIPVTRGLRRAEWTVTEMA